MSVFLEEEKLSKLENIFRKSAAANRTEIDWHIKKAFTTGIDKKFNGIVESLLADAAEPVIGKFKIHIAMLLEESIPLDIHTDYDKGDEHPGYAILIPLETVDAHTVIFNEECLDSFEEFKKTAPKIKNNATGYHNKLLSQCNKEDLEYVSVKAIEKWERGKVVMWDRKLLHTSDNFLVNGLSDKTAIVIFASK